MKKANKAALLSALILPGAGHFFLKKYISGLLLAFSSVTAFSFLTVKLIERALLIAEELQAGRVQFDLATIFKLLLKLPDGPEANQLLIATAFLIISWLISIADSYRVGWIQEKGED